MSVQSLFIPVHNTFQVDQWFGLCQCDPWSLLVHAKWSVSMQPLSIPVHNTFQVGQCFGLCQCDPFSLLSKALQSGFVSVQPLFFAEAVQSDVSATPVHC